MEMYSIMVWYLCPAVAVGIAIWCFRGALYRGPYQRFAAWILDLITQDLDIGVKEQKKAMFRLLEDRKARVRRDLKILEIGSGSAPNLKYYPANSHVVCMEPNPFFDQRADKTRKSLDNIKSVEFVNGVSEDMPFEENTFDAAVCTFVLCTVEDLPKTLEEIQRVLKPGGLFLFVEHVVAESNTWTRFLQRVMKPVHKVVFDGCITDRDTGKMILDSAMKDIHIDRFIAKYPFFWVGPCIFGNCSK